METHADVNRPASNTELHQVVDHFIAHRLTESGVVAASRADDANVLRRTMLDLVGRIPTANEAKQYIDSADPNKQMALVDRLIASPGFSRHQANELNSMLMQGSSGDLLKYLRPAVADNRPWDQIFRDLLEADPESGADQFLKSRVKDLDRLANDTSVIFFGVNVSCAQCHDHPLVSEWTQSHFFGMKSFFSRTFENGGFLGERDYGLVKFQTTSGEERVAPLMFLTGTVLEEPEVSEPTDEQKKEEKKQLDELKEKKQPPPTPAFSRRAQLATVALKENENMYFSRAIVNRVWHRLFGRGLVAPVDQMHPENPASHPELLERLASDLVAHNYDLRRLIRGLVLSEAYARSSRWEGDSYPAPELFAVASIRPLTPAQYATSLRLASMSPSWFPEDLQSDAFEQRIEQVENSARGFAGMIEQPGEDFQVSVTEALLFNNNQRITSEFLRDGNDSLVGTLKSVDDRTQLVSDAVWNVFTRPPTADEIQMLAEYLLQYRENQVIAAQQLVWALLTTNEVRFNY
ncbi:MAG: DUF1553 domain-containing protein [Planctomycetaceae bacterium]|nr:DUF1553 domain-containing protein [Planctomycetales bacterium]MCB9926581.1 DUF1553 domain-containing protein [Planctomycetaceae bacterium]